MQAGTHQRPRAWRPFELLLTLAGVLALTYAALWQLEIAPGSRVSLPEPVALRHASGAREVSLTPPADATSAVASSASAVADAPAGADPGLMPGVAQRLVISSIGLDTQVVAGGTRRTSEGVLEWETVPFVAVHYAQLTALVGAPGNAVIAGHVATRQDGNVFSDLYKVELGDTVDVWDERDAVHSFAVTGVKLVPPSDTSVMDETPDATLTLMTCGGTFDSARRLFSDRLVVTAKPAASR